MSLPKSKDFPALYPGYAFQLWLRKVSVEHGQMMYDLSVVRASNRSVLVSAQEVLESKLLAEAKSLAKESYLRITYNDVDKQVKQLNKAFLENAGK